MKPLLLALTIFLSCVSVYAQDTIVKPKNLENLFDEIYRTSSSYQKYKVISKARFQNLKLQVVDSISKYNALIHKKELLLRTEKHNLKTAKEQESKTQLALNNALKKENNISLFGMQLSKTNYSLLLWSIIIILLFVLLYFIYKFKSCHVLTKQAKNNLIDVEQEFELHRKKTLEKEQKLRRQLQDEINKQRN
jgi:hypothetical protein